MVLLRYDPPPMLQVKQNNYLRNYSQFITVLQRKSLVKILDGSLIIIETSLKKKKMMALIKKLWFDNGALMRQ